MADKKITDLTLRSNVNDDVNFPIDDTIQTYRVTAPQVAEYALARPRHLAFKTANYLASALDHVISCDAAGGDFTISLPSAVGIPGKIYIIQNTSTGLVTIDPATTELVEGVLTLDLDAGQYVTIMSDNVGWTVIGGKFNYIWQGYHDTSYVGSPWYLTNQSPFADLVNQSSAVALHETMNVNFGTVNGYGADSGSSALPGIVFTPTKLGKYMVKASSLMNVDGANCETALRMVSDTPQILDAAQAGFPGTANVEIYCPITLTGILDVTDFDPITIKIEGETSAGNTVLLGTGTGVLADIHAIDWTIYKI